MASNELKLSDLKVGDTIDHPLDGKVTVIKVSKYIIGYRHSKGTSKQRFYKALSNYTVQDLWGE